MTLPSVRDLYVTRELSAIGGRIGRAIQIGADTLPVLYRQLAAKRICHFASRVMDGSPEPLTAEEIAEVNRILMKDDNDSSV